MSTKNERMEMRLTPEDKELIERAAAITGQTVSRFAGRCLVERAREVLASHQTTLLSASDFEAVLAILDSDDPPSARLVEAAKRHGLVDD